MENDLRVSGKENDLLDEKFRSKCIIPSEEEILGPYEPNLPINRVNGAAYDNVLQYLRTHFELLREDCMQPLRQGIKALKDNSCQHDLHVYRNVRLQAIHCGRQGIEHRISFTLERIALDWETSKALREGSLLCLSSDAFQSFIWARSVGRKMISSEGNWLHVRCISDCHHQQTLQYNTEYIMVESPAAFFEAYYHVLINLQKQEMWNLPFAEHLIWLQPCVEPPDYLTLKQDRYDFSSAFPDMEHDTGSTSFPILQEWPTWSSSLDTSQMAALKHALTKRLALIQGPPGTGKTYVGRLMVNILLANLWTKESEYGFYEEGEDFNCHKRMKLDRDAFSSPLLILCYTNHALDQFLEGVFEFEKNLVRFGGRSTSTKLLECTVKRLVRKERGGCFQFRSLLRELDKLQEGITKCNVRIGIKYATLDSLRDVATHEQVENLFFLHYNNNLVKLWLQGWDKQSVENLTRGNYSSQNVALSMDELNSDVVEGNRFSSSGHYSEQRPTCSIAEQEDDAELPLEAILEEPFVWTLGKASRAALHDHWLRKIREVAEKRLFDLAAEYQSLNKRKSQLDEELLISVLGRAKVVGMTTTAAARCHGILMKLSPKVIVVEEAAEVLEGHIIACLTPYTEHLILIGDHLQLRPSVVVNKLGTDYNLDVSLFERMVTGGVEYVTLEYQRRMMPCISRLLLSLYPTLKDHESVCQFEGIKGVEKNVFFLDHRSAENHLHDSRSKFNVQEADLVVGFCAYILNQGAYKSQDVTILTMYRGQVECVENKLETRMEMEGMPKMVPLVTCVDDYQGEESNIIILSLVRNVRHFRRDGGESIGFLENENRVCVALSRARQGLFIFGNAELLASKSKLWERVIQELEQTQSIARYFTLNCQNHNKKTRVYKACDFRWVMDGGCNRRCGFKLKCGHMCAKYCHPGGHTQAVCIQRCSQSYYPCRHQCLLKCHGRTPCPPCRQSIPKSIFCGHKQLVPCSVPPVYIRCEEPCNVILACGHQCARKCGQECTRRCPTKVKKDLPCGHTANLPCHLHPDKQVCLQPCGKTLKPSCDHICRGTCASCKGGRAHVRCHQRCAQRFLCGHECKNLCYQPCQPCADACENRCFHRQCPSLCGEICQPCLEPCLWNCVHYQCSLHCYEICQRPRCNEPCSNLLKCGHRCIGICGEPCPTRCRICHPHTLETFSSLKIQEIDSAACFVQLQDCGHLFEYTMLDELMDNAVSSSEEAAVNPSVQLKKCPRCQTAIRRTLRYALRAVQWHHNLEVVQSHL